MSEALTPIYDRIVVKRHPEERTTAGGLVIPDGATEKSSQGTVIAVGQGKRLDNGNFAIPLIKEGQSVVFGKYAGTEVKHKGQDYLVMREDDVMAVIDEQ